MISDQHQRLVRPFTNGTGSASVKGQIVAIGSADDTYVAAVAGTTTAFGVVLVADVPDGGKVPICLFGRCQVLSGTLESADSGVLVALSRSESGKAEYGTGDDALKAQGIGRLLESLFSPGALAWIDFQPSKTADVGVADPS